MAVSTPQDGRGVAHHLRPEHCDRFFDLLGQFYEDLPEPPAIEATSFPRTRFRSRSAVCWCILAT